MIIDAIHTMRVETFGRVSHSISRERREEKRKEGEEATNDEERGCKEDPFQ